MTPIPEPPTPNYSESSVKGLSPAEIAVITLAVVGLPGMLLILLVAFAR